MIGPMPARIALADSTVTISRDDAFLVCQPDGRIVAGAAEGFFAADTRLLSAWELRLDGVLPTVLASAPVGPAAARFQLVNEALERPGGGVVKAQGLDLRLDRIVGPGLHEDIDLRSWLDRPVHLTLELRLGFDFADLFDVRAGRPHDRGRRTLRWEADRARLRATYANETFQRGLELTVEQAGSPPDYRAGRIEFAVALPARGSWHACLMWRQLGPGRQRSAAPRCVARTGLPGQGATAGPPARIEAAEAGLLRAWDRAVADLDGLRLRAGSSARGLGAGDSAGHRSVGRGPVVPAAGVPWFLALFGRDSLIVSLQSLPVFPEFIRGSLERLAALQAAGEDAAREMEPGKIPHELRHDELTELGRLPYGPSYATHDATSLFIVALAEAYRWTADRRFVERLLPAAEAALGWVDRFGDRDGDGLQEYGRRTSTGYRNQGWKDSEDGIPNADGSQPELPIALVELQGYAYAAKLGLAGLFELVGRAADARRLRDEAARLFALVNERLWWEAEGTYFLGLDGSKRPIASVASNAGHLLWSGIVPPERAGRVAARLLAPDMWSGWGIRTLSAAHPGFDPFSYHRGSVWPHDNGLIAAGLRGYGLTAEADQVARGILDAASRFADDRLPELFAGLTRDEASFPVPYRGANVPQAWAAGSVLQLVAAVAGLDVAVAGPRRRQLQAPGPLPAWLPRLTFRDLRLARRRVDLAVGYDRAG